MESTGPLSPPDPEPEVSSARNGEKRAISAVSSGEDGEEEVVVASKKVKYDCAELSRVAEIVLVLAAMGRIRGGKDPTAEEVSLMAEAREKLVSMIENFSPKDIVESEAVGRVMEDLGLNGKVKDQRLGFKVPKLSIAEKITFAKRKVRVWIRAFVFLVELENILSGSYVDDGRDILSCIGCILLDVINSGVF